MQRAQALFLPKQLVQGREELAVLSGSVFGKFPASGSSSGTQNTKYFQSKAAVCLYYSIKNVIEGFGYL